jgi:hypothetical protein
MMPSSNSTVFKTREQAEATIVVVLSVRMLAKSKIGERVLLPVSIMVEDGGRHKAGVAHTEAVC